MIRERAMNSCYHPSLSYLEVTHLVERLNSGSTGAQVHEWGGLFAALVAYSHFRQFRPGLRIAINPHGGHYWSTQVRWKGARGLGFGV
jgi:hypothetical protein